MSLLSYVVRRILAMIPILLGMLLLTFMLFLQYNTDPNNNDTDSDNLVDGRELRYHTDLFNPDIDEDGHLDGNEVNIYNTEPLNPDTDGDGISDGDETINNKTDSVDENSVRRKFLIAHYFGAPLISIMGVGGVLVKKFKK